MTKILQGNCKNSVFGQLKPRGKCTSRNVGPRFLKQGTPNPVIRKLGPIRPNQSAAHCRILWSAYTKDCVRTRLHAFGQDKVQKPKFTLHAGDVYLCSIHTIQMIHFRWESRILLSPLHTQFTYSQRPTPYYSIIHQVCVHSTSVLVVVVFLCVLLLLLLFTNCICELLNLKNKNIYLLITRMSDVEVLFLG